MNSDFLPEIISVEDLRQEIGDPTENPQFASYISDETLQHIIDRHVDWLESQAFQRLKENRAKPVKQTEQVTLECTQDSSVPGLTVAQLDDGYFPYGREGVVVGPAEHAGQTLEYTFNLFQRVKKSFHEFYGFDIENNVVLVSPAEVTDVTLYLPKRIYAVREIMADTISDVNANIIERARQAQQAREREFAEPAYAGGGPSPETLGE